MQESVNPANNADLARKEVEDDATAKSPLQIMDEFDSMNILDDDPIGKDVIIKDDSSDPEDNDDDSEDDYDLDDFLGPPPKPSRYKFISRLSVIIEEPENEVDDPEDSYDLDDFLGPSPEPRKFKFINRLSVIREESEGECGSYEHGDTDIDSDRDNVERHTASKEVTEGLREFDYWTF